MYEHNCVHVKMVNIYEIMVQLTMMADYISLFQGFKNNTVPMHDNDLFYTTTTGLNGDCYAYMSYIYCSYHYYDLQLSGLCFRHFYYNCTYLIPSPLNRNMIQ